MPGFLVDSRTLLAVRDTLGRLHDELLSMHTTIYGSWGALGGHELEGELEHFCGTWHYGVTELAGQITDLMRRLTEAAAAYERIEHRITHAGSGTGSGTGTGTGTTVIDPGAPAGSRVQTTPSGGGHHGGSGSGTTVIGGGSGSGTTVIGGRSGSRPGAGSRPGSGSGSGSGTTVIDGGAPAGDGARTGSGTTTIG